MWDAPEARILVVDDDNRQADRIVAILNDAGYQVSREADSLNALLAVEDEQPALVLLDWNMPFIDGIVFTHSVRVGMMEPPPVVALIPRDGDAAATLRAGARTYLRVPADADTLLRIVRELLGTAPP